MDVEPGMILRKILVFLGITWARALNILNLQYTSLTTKPHKCASH